MDIKVSVIIPVYNAQKYLRVCLDSVIKQALKEIEIICINDGSTDESLNILNEYAKRDERIIVIDQKNSGTAVSRNAGIENAKGEFIGFIDADDYIEENYYEALFTQCKKENADLANALAIGEFFSRESEVFYTCPKLVNYKLNDICLTKNFVYNGVWDSLFRLELINQNKIRFDKENLFCEDLDFANKAKVLSKKTIAVINTAYHYRQEIDTQKTLTTTHPQKVKFMYRSVKGLFSFIDNIVLDKHDYLDIFFINMNAVNGRTQDILLNDDLSKNQKEIFFHEACEIFNNCKFLNELKENFYQPFFKYYEQKNFEQVLVFYKNLSKHRQQTCKFNEIVSRSLDTNMENFFSHNEKVYVSAIRILTILKKHLVQIKSVLDINCGSGLWLRALKDTTLSMKDTNITGITVTSASDPQSLSREKLFVDFKNIQTFDIDKDNIESLKNKYDLIFSIGHIEKLNEVQSKSHIQKITQISDIILFCPEHYKEDLNISSAIKNPPAFWSYQFRQRGFICFDFIREKVWDDPWVSKEYKQGVLLYVKQSKAQILLQQGLKPVDTPKTFYTQEFLEDLTYSGLTKLKKYRKYYQASLIIAVILLITLILLIIAG